MKTEEAGKEKQSQKDGPSSHCRDFGKIAGMMKRFCSGEGDPVDCCFVMMSTMSRCKEGEHKEAEETRKPAAGGEGA